MTLNLLFADKSLNSLEIAINNELANVCDWLLANKLILNIKKIELCDISPSPKKGCIQF